MHQYQGNYQYQLKPTSNDKKYFLLSYQNNDTCNLKVLNALDEFHEQ